MIITLRLGKSRFLCQYLKTFLEMVGFVTEAAAAGGSASDASVNPFDLDCWEDSTEFDKLLYNAQSSQGEESGESGVHPYDLEGVKKQLFMCITSILSAPEVGLSQEELGCIRGIWDNIYCHEVMKSVYVISDLYINRKMHYENIELIEEAMYHLNRISREIEGNCSKSVFDAAAYCYLAVQVNDALFKMRVQPKHDPGMLLELCDRISMEHKGEIVWLLRANIMSNVYAMENKLETYYEEMLESISRGLERLAPLKKYFLFGMGELLQVRAERRKEPLYTQAVEYYEKYMEIDPHNIRVLFKIALFYERKADLNRAKKYYTDLCLGVENIVVEQRNNIDFEYYYKSQFRLGVIGGQLHHYKEAIGYFERASGCWDDLDENLFARDMFVEEPTLTKVKDFLKEKYKMRDCVIWKQMGDMYAAEKDSEKAAECFMRADFAGHRYGRRN